MLLAVAVMLAAAAVASAHRPASRAEKAAMIYHAGSRYDHLSAKDVDEPEAFPLRCAIADIATVVAGSRWGGWGLPAHIPGVPHRIAADVLKGLG